MSNNKVVQSSWAAWSVLSTSTLLVLSMFVCTACQSLYRVSSETRADAISRTVSIAVTAATDEQIRSGEFQFYGSTGLMLGGNKVALTTHGIRPFSEGRMPRLFVNRVESPSLLCVSSSLDDLSIVKFVPSAGDDRRMVSDKPMFRFYDTSSKCILPGQQLYVAPPYQSFPGKYQAEFVEAIRIEVDPPLSGVGFDDWEFVILIDSLVLSDIDEFQGWSGCPVFFADEQGDLLVVGLISEGVIGKRKGGGTILLIRVATFDRICTGSCCP